MVTLCLDFGNTRCKAAVFTNAEFTDEVVLAAPAEQELLPVLDKYKPSRSILSSVINHDPAIEPLLAKNTKYHRLSSASTLPFTAPVGRPETIGTDRLALSAAAVHFYPGKNNLVIALGSCITYNFINQYHQFLGGAISPGMEMRFKSMHEYTAKLPLAPKDWNFPVIAYDTKTNLQSGVLAGICFEI